MEPFIPHPPLHMVARVSPECRGTAEWCQGMNIGALLRFQYKISLAHEPTFRRGMARLPPPEWGRIEEGGSPDPAFPPIRPFPHQGGRGEDACGSRGMGRLPRRHIPYIGISGGNPLDD
jgi:hypothetical protein